MQVENGIDEREEGAPPPPPIATMHVVMWLAFENTLCTWNPAASLGFPPPAKSAFEVRRVSVIPTTAA